MPLTCSIGRIASVVLVVMTGLNVGSVCGQDYPNKPIRIITAPPGGGADIVTRVIAQGLAASSGWQVVVDSRPGSLRMELVAKSAPDGYTLLLEGNDLWISPFLQKTPYDPDRDFSPVTLVDIGPLVLVVHSSLPVKSVKELIALAKARPGELNYASSVVGSGTHLAAELFKAMANVKIVSIPYKGSGPALASLMAGETQLMFPTSGQPELKSAKLRALAVTSREPSALAPGLPTLAASGMPGFEAVNIHGMFVPAKTPGPVVARLNQEIVRVLRQADVKERFLSLSLESVGSSPEELAAAVKSDAARMGKVIKDAGIRAE
jgi:tripartite-type tricarboxylate transporter receptor subunit TctC